MTLSNRIQKLRKKKGISQEELAHCLKVSRQAISKWESNQSLPDIDKILQMSEYFEVTTDYLLKGIESSTQAKINGQQLYIGSTMMNLIGLILTILLWKEYQNSLCAIPVFLFQTVGIAMYWIGYTKAYGNDKKVLIKKFWSTNIWLIVLIPYLLVTNSISMFFNTSALTYWLIAMFPYFLLCTIVSLWLNKM